MKVKAAVVQDDKAGLCIVPRQAGVHLQSADCQMRIAPAAYLLVQGFDIVAVEPRLPFRSAVDQTDGVMRQDTLEIDFGGANQSLPHPATVLEPSQIARSFFQGAEKVLFRILS